MNKAKLRDNLLKYSAGTTQAAVARELNVTPAAVHRWYSGERIPTLYAGYRLCKFLGITVEQLMEGVVDE